MLHWIVWNRTFFYIKMDLALNNLQRLICQKNQTVIAGNETWDQIMNEIVCISFHTNALRNDINPSLPLTTTTDNFRTDLAL